jgi:hypothetical protein
MKLLELITVILFSFIVAILISIGIRLSFNYDMGFIGPCVLLIGFLCLLGWIKGILS